MTRTYRHASPIYLTHLSDCVRFLAEHTGRFAVKQRAPAVVTYDGRAIRLSVDSRSKACIQCTFNNTREAECYVRVPNRKRNNECQSKHQRVKLAITYMHFDSKQIDPLKFSLLARDCHSGGGAHCTSRLSSQAAPAASTALHPSPSSGQ